MSPASKTSAPIAPAKVHETLTYFALPGNHWRQIKTNPPGTDLPRDPAGGGARIAILG